MTTPDFFKNNFYIDCKQIIPADLCNVVTKYCLMREENFNEPEPEDEGQVPFAHSVYADTLMETLEYFLLPHMEASTGLSLCPTYSYYRVYRPGQELERHKDRESCEVSTSVCFGIQYNDVDKDYHWSMYVDKDSNHTPKLGNFISANNLGTPVQQTPGDILIYRGVDIEHWRDKFVAGLNSYHVQGFFHYIDKDGPYYPEWIYDKRPRLGYKES
jgi:hypothetical protein|tara:strand:+ start:7944 stop:8588 length:645 start_codon:yes stop_codon:yes gene_type:complete